MDLKGCDGPCDVSKWVYLPLFFVGGMKQCESMGRFEGFPRKIVECLGW